MCADKLANLIAFPLLIFGLITVTAKYVGPYASHTPKGKSLKIALLLLK